MRRLVFAGLAALVLASLVALSCSRKEKLEAPATAPTGTTGPVAVDPASLAPVFTFDGGSDRLPTSVTVQLARPVQFAWDENGMLSADTSLRFEPSVSGEFAIAGPSTLRFTTHEGFAPDEEYHVTLESIATQDGVLEPPSEGAWTATHRTPAFRFDSATLTGLDVADHRAIVEVAFTGPIDATQALERVTFRQGGTTLSSRLAWGIPDEPETEDAAAPAREARVGRMQRRNTEPPPPAHVLRVLVSSAGVAPGRTIDVEIDRGVRLLGRRETAPAAQASVPVVEFPLLPEVVVLGAAPAEGTNGFYVEIVCDDGAVEEERWYWDPSTQQGYDGVSTRCRLDDGDLAERLSFEPPVAFTTAPSGAGVRVFGDFRRGSYVLKLRPGVRTQDRGIVRRPFETTLSVPARTPRVSFASPGRYLPRDQWRSLTFRHLNVDAVDVTVRHVRAENLVFWASAETEATSARESDVVATTRLSVKGEPDTLATAWLDVASLVPATTRGLLEVTLTAGSISESARLVLTDLQVVAKRDHAVQAGTGGEVRAWVFDAESLKPVSGAHVELVRPSGQVAASATSDSSGEARLRVSPRTDVQEAPFALLVKKDRDVTYLAFDEVQAEVDDEHVGGEAPDAEVPWRAALFTDRGVYRPGETAHAAAIVRDAAGGPAPKDMPVALRLVDPRGRVLLESPRTVSAAGFVTLDLPFEDFATTGRHELQLDVATQRVATHRFHVEEFVPERMKVEVSATSGEALVGDPLTVSASARYLFGGVPKDHQAELTCTLEPGDFTPKQNAQFHYGPWRDEERLVAPVTLGTSTGVLDADGRVTLSCATAESGSLAGPGRVIASVAIFEAGGGRSTIGQATATLHPARHVIGLSSRTAQGRGGEPLRVEGIVADWTGQPIDAVKEVELTLLRLEREHGWWWDESSGQSTRRNALRAVPEGTVKARVGNGRFEAELTPSGGALAWLVRATAGGARSELRIEGSETDGWWDAWEPGHVADRTPRPGKPAWLPIEAPELARVGHDIDVTLTAPHRGRLLLTAEAEGVLEREWKEVEAGPVSWSFELEEFRPNVYVSALLVKPPHLESRESFLPDRAYGVVSIPVQPERHALPVSVKAPSEVRSGSPLTVTVDIGAHEGPAQVVVSAVDEGILSLTKFQTPDPLAQVFTRRALGVATFETVGWTLLQSPPPQSGARSGDELLDLGRVQAIKPVALWSGLVDVPKSGKAEVTFHVPTYRGQLRVTAVAATPTRMGSGSASVIVRDPLTLQVTLPRFLTQDDVAQVPVFVTNVSGASRRASVTLTAEPLETEPTSAGLPTSELVQVTSAARELDLKDGESGTALFTLRVRGKAGAVRLTAVATAGDLRSHDELEAPILPTGPRTRVLRRIEIEEGETSLTQALSGWEPMTERTTIRVTSSPYADALGHLSYLVRYPYGCIEQTVSTARPLLAMQGLALEIDPKLLAQGTLEDRVDAGIARVLSMQLPSGGFGYWPGALQEAWWGTAYATDFLIDAQAGGHVVPADRVEAALAWMEDRIANHYEKGRQHGDWYSENAEPYMHWVLARGGRARPARIETLLAAVPGESESHRLENRYMLMAALHRSGNRRFETELRSPDLSPIVDERRNDWTFYSDLRRRGLVLATRTELFGSDAQGQRLADLVAERLRSAPSPHWTTQELVWGLIGLSRISGASATFAPPSLRAGGREIAPMKPAATAGSSRTWDVPRASERGEVTVSVPSKGDGRLYAILSIDGVPSGAVAVAGSQGLRVERSFADGKGVPVQALAQPLSLGETLNVVLTVTNTTSERIANVVLTGRVPAGWEIENPRLGRGTALGWLPEEELWQVDHVDVRDDRLEAFGHLDPGQTGKVAYAVRAVTSGRFTLPPAEAQAMYEPSTWGRELGGVVEVTGPWTPVAQ